MILLDTHIFVWVTLGIGRIGRRARALIEDSRAHDEAHVSVVSCWEIATLVDRDRLVLYPDVRSWVRRALAQPGIVTARLTPDIALAAGSLPGGMDGDPADRILLATAQAIGCPLVTGDRHMLAYGSAGHVEVIDARD